MHDLLGKEEQLVLITIKFSNSSAKNSAKVLVDKILIIDIIVIDEQIMPQLSSHFDDQHKTLLFIYNYWINLKEQRNNVSSQSKKSTCTSALICTQK